MDKESSLSQYISKAQNLSIDSCNKKIRIGILGSFTLNGLEETIRVKCQENKINCSTYLAGYNQINQEILNLQSPLYKFKPDNTTSSSTVYTLANSSLVGFSLYSIKAESGS